MLRKSLVGAILCSLKAYYWIFVEVAEALKSLTSKTNNQFFRHHSTLACKRVESIVEGLKLTLQTLGFSLEGRPSRDWLVNVAGTYPVRVLENLKKDLEELTSNVDMIFSGRPQLLTGVLEEYARMADMASHMIRVYKNYLAREKSDRFKRAVLILENVARDLDIIVLRHREITETLMT